PSLDLSVGATEGTNVTANGVETDAAARSVGLSAGYEVDLWGRIGAQTRSSAMSAAASAEAVQTAALTLTAELARQWYAMAENRQILLLLEAQEATAAEYLEVLRLRFIAGQTRAANLLQQRDLVASLQAEQAQTQAGLATARHALAALLGRNPARAPESDRAALVSLSPLPATGLPAELVQHRPDLRRALYSLRAAEQDVAVAVAQRFPRLNLTGSASSRSAEWDGLLDNWSRTLVADLVAPLVDGGRRRAEVERSRAAVDEAIADYREAILAAFVEVEDALVRERGQRRFLAYVDERLQLNRQVLERQRDYYRSGDGDFLNVLDAQRNLQTRERERITAQRQLIEFRIALYRALAGGLIDLPEPEPKLETTVYEPS
uniref:efflux transporter outer membrane subunit n=1 Tax=Thiohalomonas denitrificans TaxID=415747 RepID=UPI0026EA8D92